jgi:hypothetical protein
VLATGFAVLLGFVSSFLAFAGGYDTSRSGAEAEAEIVAQPVRDVRQFFPAADSPPALRGELESAYARTVISPGVGRRLQAGTLGDTDNQSWGVRHVPHSQDGSSRGPSTEQAAVRDQWLESALPNRS